MNFFNISDLSTKEIIQIIDDKNSNKILTDKNIGLLFEKQSTRTRLSFIAGISNLGGNSIDLRYEELILVDLKSLLRILLGHLIVILMV
jgi:ornithine carbamoyltransferase